MIIDTILDLIKEYPEISIIWSLGIIFIIIIIACDKEIRPSSKEELSYQSLATLFWPVVFVGLILFLIGSSIKDLVSWIINLPPK